MRPNKIDYYFQLAVDVAARSTCIRRRFGAILVKNDCIISSGYNGSVRGSINCGEDGKCLKDIHNEQSIVSYNHCPAIHAEMNAILNAVREGVSTLGATTYLSEASGNCGGNERPCYLCRRIMIQAGIKDIYYYTIIHDKGSHKVSSFKYANMYKEVVHENVADWVSMENNWMQKEKA